MIVGKPSDHHIGQELLIELVHAGYLQGHRYGNHVAGQLNQLVEDYMHIFNHLREAHVSRDVAMDWVLAVLSVETAGSLHRDCGEAAGKRPCLLLLLHQGRARVATC